MQRSPYAILQIAHGKLPAAKEVAIHKSDFVIGRGSTADLQLEDPRISRLQAMIYYREGNWFLQDKSSNQNTLVNGKKVRAIRLKSGDHITIGDNEFVFLTPELAFLPVQNAQSPVERAVSSVRQSAALAEKTDEADWRSESPAKPHVRHFALIVFSGLLGLVILFIVILSLYGRGQFLRAQRAYEEGDCQTSLSYLDALLNNRWNFLFRSQLVQGEKMRTECQAFIQWQVLIENGDYLSSREVYEAFAQSFAGSPLLAFFDQEILRAVKEQQSCAPLLSYGDRILVYESKDAYLSHILKCASEAESKGLYQEAYEQYMAALHQLPSGIELVPVHQALVKNPYACQQLGRMSSELSANQATLIDLYKFCLQTYIEIDNLDEAISTFEKLTQTMTQANLTEQLFLWLKDQPWLCVHLDRIISREVDQIGDEFSLQLVHHCQQEFAQKGDFLAAIRLFEKLLPKWNEKLNPAYAQLLYQYAATFRRSASKPERLRLTSAEEGEITIQNRSPYAVRIVFLGAETLVIEIPACLSRDACITTSRKCAPGTPQANVNLSLGNYDVAILWLNPEPLDAEVTSFAIEQNSVYQWCILR